MEESNPFYKDRVLSPLQNKSKTLKLSSEVLNEYEKHFKSKYPYLIKKDGSLNDNKIITNLLIDYLNTQCLERKYFNLDVLVAVPKLQDEKTTRDYLILGIRNDYKIVECNLQHKYSTVNRTNDGFFNYEEIISLNKIHQYLKMNYFTYYFLGLGVKDQPFNEFLNCVNSVLVEAKINDYSFIFFRVNNFLDLFEDGIYKGEGNNSNIHRGIGEASLEDGSKIYFVYNWEYNPLNIFIENFDLKDFEVISKEMFITLVFNSTNKDLIKFVKDDEKVKHEDILSHREINLKNKNIELIETVNNLINDKKINEYKIKKLEDRIRKLEEKI